MEQGEKSDLNDGPRAAVPALRIVHLAGGLRAVDLNKDQVEIEAAAGRPFGAFGTPDYSHLFQVLGRLGFRPIGVDFLTNHATAEGAPPDWQAYHAGRGFYAMDAERAWAAVRHVASTEGNSSLEILASKANTYLRLLPLRLRQLSEAYNHCLARAVTGRSTVAIGHHFGNEWGEYIDAAVHAFLADAGAFRDVLAEIVWRIILGKDDDRVTSLAGLLKRTKSERHPLVISIRTSADGGWLHQLSNLRNHIVHVAPVKDSQEHHMCELRGLKVPSGPDAPTLHLSLLQCNGEVRKPLTTYVYYRDETAIKSSISSYHEYVKTSQDTINVCEDFCVRLVELSMQIKQTGQLQEKEIIITSDDIIGPIEIY